MLNDVEFMEALVGYMPEDVKLWLKGLHWHRYGWRGDALNFGHFRADVNAMVSKTRELGVQWDWRAWLTEYGVIGWGTEGFGIGQVVQFINQTVPWLDNKAFLQRYAWFCWKKHESQQFPVRELARPAYGTAYKNA